MQIVELTTNEMDEHRRRGAALFEDIDRDGISLVAPAGDEPAAPEDAGPRLVTRTAKSNRGEAVIRERTASAYLEVAQLVLAEPTREEFLSVATGLAVLAGIAASDALCGMRLGQRHGGEDHRGALELLARATPDGRALAGALARLIDVKGDRLRSVPSRTSGPRTAPR